MWQSLDKSELNKRKKQNKNATTLINRVILDEPRENNRQPRHKAPSRWPQQFVVRVAWPGSPY